MQRLGRKRPEVPDAVRIAQVRLRMPLLRVNEVWKLYRIADKKDGRIVANEIVVAFFCVKLEREATRVAIGVGISVLAGDRRKASEYFRALTDMAEETGARVFGDVVRDLKIPERSTTLGVNNKLGDPFTIEVGFFSIR